MGAYHFIKFCLSAPSSFCLLLFYKNYNVYQNCSHVSIIRVMGAYHFIKFCLCAPSSFCVLLFYKKYNVYNDVYMLISSELHVSITSPSFVCLHLPVSEIAKCIS